MKQSNGSVAANWLFVSKWILATTVGWLVCPLFVGNVLIHSWPEWRQFVTAYFVNGALIGLTVAVGQGLVLGLGPGRLLRWALATVFGYGLGLPASILFISALSFFGWPPGLPMLTGSQNTFIELSVRQAALGALLIGLSQWLNLPIGETAASRRGLVIWLFGNLAGLAIGANLATLAGSLMWQGAPLGPIAQMIQRGLLGAFLGLATGITLVMLPRYTRPPASLVSTLPTT